MERSDDTRHTAGHQTLDHGRLASQKGARYFLQSRVQG